MSGYAIVLHGESVRALVVGAGAVAARKVAALLDAGASVRIIAPTLSKEMSAVLAGRSAEWIGREYARSLLDDSNLVFAATNSAEVNAAVAHDARELGLRVNVASDAGDGDFSTPATHRDGNLLVAVYTGGVPAAAARIRDAIAAMLATRISGAIARLAKLRQSKLDAGNAAAWNEARSELIGEDFLASVASGEFDRRFGRWD